MTRVVRVFLYGDVNLNIIDGSAIWLQSMAQVWAGTGAQVDVQLKAPETRALLSGPLRKIPGVTVLDATPESADALTHAEVVAIAEARDAQAPYDVVMARGLQVCRALSEQPSLASKLWAYVTEYAYGSESFDEDRQRIFSELAGRARFVLAQTDEARSVLESLIPEAAGKALLLGPMIPDTLTPKVAAQEALGTAENPLRLIYTGKFAKDWRTDLMPELVPELEKLGVIAELTMVGDKVHNERSDPNWALRMNALINRKQPRVHWAGGKDRATSLEMVSNSHIALSWRSTQLDLSLEMSTKVLEASGLGVPSIINRTPMHQNLLGEDYPLLVDARADSVADIASRIRDALPELHGLSERVHVATEQYRMASRVSDLMRYLRRIGIVANDQGFSDAVELPERLRRSNRPLRVLLASHDLKFAGELVTILQRLRGVELRFDHWEALHRHDAAASQECLDWADIVICEWAGSNAVWYSQHKRPDQRLVVRLHMFEFRGHWLSKIDTDNVDLFIAVSEYTRELIEEQLEVPAMKVAVIPNAVSFADFRRPAVAGREHRIGLVGFVPLLKRPDRAIELLRRLREQDDRFTLHIRGRMPWEYRHLWQKPEQREAYLDLFARLGADNLHTAIAFEPFGADMANWYRKIGWMLSPSTTESFHLAPAEGTASGALPVFWERPGVRQIFGDEFVVPDTKAAAEFILATNRDADIRARRIEIARSVVAPFDEQIVEEAWVDAVCGPEQR
ncbi:MAG: glycosyltransferase [Gulosibacter sp.]|uniref:glycosyltransferase n=1 Tax=Gulosibacter sp. TaxID=2817531 RepID=UPI003F916C76